MEREAGELVMHRHLITAVCVLVSSLVWGSDRQCPTPVNDARLSVSQLSAAAIALARFKKEQPNAVEYNVYVLVSESDREYKIAFSPRANPSEVGHEGATDYITLDNPQGNQYGRFVEYRISKKLQKIIGVTYAK
jgi:hypothetical protein